MSTRKEDIRIVKTKKALTDAFFDMLASMSMDDITVNDLCERADVRRATFYKHFKDKNDFIIFLIKDIREKFDTDVWDVNRNTALTSDYYLEYAGALISYLLGREAAIKKLVSSPMRSTFINVFLLQNYDDTKKRLDASIESGMQLMASSDVVAGMLVGGVALCIVKWFDSNERSSEESLLTDISKFIERVLG